MEYLKNLYEKFIKWPDGIEKEHAQEKQQKREEAYRIFVDGWGMKVHCQDEQVMRFKRAINNELSKNGYVNFYDLSTTFRSRKNAKQKYKTTLKNCSCPDFQHRNLPCKHMYRLACLLGIIDGSWDLSGVPADISSKINLLPPSSRKLFINIISKHIGADHSFSVKNNRNLTPIFEAGLLIKEDYAYTELYQYNKNDLIAAIATSGCDFEVRSSTTKNSLIQYIINSDNKKLIKFKNSYINIRLPQDIAEISYFISRKYLEH